MGCGSRIDPREIPTPNAEGWIRGFLLCGLIGRACGWCESSGVLVQQAEKRATRSPGPSSPAAWLPPAEPAAPPSAPPVSKKASSACIRSSCALRKHALCEWHFEIGLAFTSNTTFFHQSQQRELARNTKLRFAFILVDTSRNHSLNPRSTPVRSRSPNLSK